MKKKLLILLLSICFVAQIQAQTGGTLSVSVATSSAGGNYAPKNIVAIWVEDNSGKFVKTLLAFANNRITYLNTWQASTLATGNEFNKTDAITGATQSSHGIRTCQWNGTDYTGKLMPDGEYKVRMELTDKNATGNFASFLFTKGPNAQKQTPVNVPSFSSVSLNWTTSVTGINPEVSVSNSFIVYPNPGIGQFSVIGENIKILKVTDLTGKVICTSQTPIFDLTDQPKGIYFVTVQSEIGTMVKKIIKK